MSALSKRALRRAGAVVVVGGVLVAAGWVAVRDRAPAADAAAETDDRSTAAVQRRDLERVEKFDGAVGHGALRALALSGAGTVTGLPTVGDQLSNGDVLAEIDGEPVLLLQGTRPAWRPMQNGMRDGEDVRQLETALVELGYVDPADIEVDDTWTADTTVAVKTLQTWIGRPVTGRLELGDIVFHDGALRIGTVDGALGDPAGSAGIEVGGTTQVVTMSVSASDAQQFQQGGALRVELPSGDLIDAAVSEIGAPQTGQDGSTSVPVLLQLSADGASVIDGTPVDVHVTTVAAADVLAVPAEALLALAEGGYAIEVVDSSTPSGTRLVGVEVGEFADGWVQIDGAVDEGADVVVA